MTIVVKTSEGDTHKFPTARNFKFVKFNKFIKFSDYTESTVAMFKVRDVVGWWEE